MREEHDNAEEHLQSWQEMIANDNPIHDNPIRDNPIRNNPKRSNLGSLAQAARSTHLKSARAILIIVGILTCGMNAYRFVDAEDEADEAIRNELRAAGPRAVLDPVAAKQVKETVVRFCQLIYGATFVLGLVFIGLGMAVYRIPVLATVLGLVLYVGAYLAFGALDPANLYAGIVLKIIITVSLFKAMQAAIAYQREQREASLGYES